MAQDSRYCQAGKILPHICTGLAPFHNDTKDSTIQGVLLTRRSHSGQSLDLTSHRHDIQSLLRPSLERSGRSTYAYAIVRPQLDLVQMGHITVLCIPRHATGRSNHKKTENLGTAANSSLDLIWRCANDWGGLSTGLSRD